MREGAYDFITKPTKRGEVLACIDRILERQRLIVENKALKGRARPGARPRGARGHERTLARARVGR